MTIKTDLEAFAADCRKARAAHKAIPRWTGAYLQGADLQGAYLRGAKLPPGPVVPDLDRKILKAIKAGGTLDMSSWHTCATTHCRAGWAITLAGDEGKKLESEVGSAVAGTLIYHASTGRVPDFYAKDDAAMADIRRCADATV